MDTKKTLLHSVDAKVYRHNFKLFLYFYLGLQLFGIITGIIVFLDFPKEIPKALLYSFICFTLVFGPRVLRYAWKLHRIAKRSHAFIFSECTLSETGCARGHYYFRVKLKTAEGTVETCTRPIYSDTSTYACYQDWKNKRVIVAYDREDDIAIVIGKATEEWKQLLSS